MPAAKQWEWTRSAEVSGEQSSNDLRQLRTSCHERKRESERGWSCFPPERYSSAVPAPCGVTMYGRMPTATWPSTTFNTSRAYSQAWITRQSLARGPGAAVPSCGTSSRSVFLKPWFIKKTAQQLRKLLFLLWFFPEVLNSTSRGCVHCAWPRTARHRQTQSGRA